MSAPRTARRTTAVVAAAAAAVLLGLGGAAAADPGASDGAPRSNVLDQVGQCRGTLADREPQILEFDWRHAYVAREPQILEFDWRHADDYCDPVR